MITYVLKKPRKRILISAAVIAAAILAGIILTILIGNESRDTLSLEGRSVSLLAANEEELCAFAREIGLDISEGITLEREITVPENFDEVYEIYNDMQKSIGLDLYPYRGQAAQLYRSNIREYGDIESAVATFIVCGGRIIGGDISDEEAGGEMRALV